MPILTSQKNFKESLKYLHVTLNGFHTSSKKLNRWLLLLKFPLDWKPLQTL